MWQSIKYHLRMKWWKVKTWARVLLPSVRKHWRERFKNEPCLHNARYHHDFRTMAAFYNDTTPCGHMSESQARRLYQ